MTEVALHRLGGAEVVRLVREGNLSVEELARSCLDHVARREPMVKAWAWLDGSAVLAQARELDKATVKRPLHGLPIGVKDMILTKDMPTEHNSPIYVGHRPRVDAACVQILRAAGALIFGKTETVEFAATGRKAPTTHPLDSTRSPGGTSSGSAAAVADWHVPVALGTQTAGSAIRPASFCGIFAIKPTWGAVSREGLKTFANSLDTLSWMGRTAADLELLADAFEIPEMEVNPLVRTLQGARVGVCRTSSWERAEIGAREAFERAAGLLSRAGADVVELELPDTFRNILDTHATIMNGEARVAFLSEYRANYELLHEDLRSRVENTTGVTPRSLCEAYDLAARSRIEFDELARNYDVIVTPSAADEAPEGLENTGDPSFNRLWSLLHVPCVNVPGLLGPAGFPIGITLTGPRFADRKLLRIADLVGRLLHRDGAGTR